MRRIAPEGVKALLNAVKRFPPERPSVLEYVAIVQAIEEVVVKYDLRQIYGEAISRYKRSTNNYPRCVRRAAGLLWNPINLHQDVIGSFNKTNNYQALDRAKNWQLFQHFMWQSACSIMIPGVESDE